MPSEWDSFGLCRWQLWHFFSPLIQAPNHAHPGLHITHTHVFYYFCSRRLVVRHLSERRRWWLKWNAVFFFFINRHHPSNRSSSNSSAAILTNLDLSLDVESKLGLRVAVVGWGRRRPEEIIEGWQTPEDASWVQIDKEKKGQKSKIKLVCVIRRPVSRSRIA